MELPLFVKYGLSTDIHVVDIPFQYIKSMKWIIHAMVISMDNDTSRVCSCTIINIPKWWGQIGILNWQHVHIYYSEVCLSGVCHFLPPSHLLSLNRGEFIASQLQQVIVTQFQRALRPNLAGHCDLP